MNHPLIATSSQFAQGDRMGAGLRVPNSPISRSFLWQKNLKYLSSVPKLPPNPGGISLGWSGTAAPGAVAAGAALSPSPHPVSSTSQKMQTLPVGFAF